MNLQTHRPYSVTSMSWAPHHFHPSKMHSIIAFLCIGSLFLLGANGKAPDFDITKSNVKLQIPGKASLIHISSTTHSDSLPNVTFPTFSFTEPSHTDLLTLTLAEVNGTSKVFIGARNFIHRLYAEESYNSNRRLVLDETSPKITFRNKSACPTVFAKELGLSVEPTDNDMKILFVYPGKALFACGTDNCGRCESFKLHDFTAQRGFYNNKVENVADFMSGRKSAYVFKGHYQTATAYFIAIEPDGRKREQTPPFFSARAIKNTQIIYTSSHSNFASRIKLNEQISSTHPMKILYGFEHRSYSYLLTVQPDSLNNDTALLETRLSRVCTSDHYFESYMEIPLYCKVNLTIYREAITAFFSQNATSHFDKRSFTNEALGSVSPSLFISFKSEHGLLSQSPLCQFDIAKIDETFQNTAIRCNTNGDEVGLLPTFHGSGLNLCTRIESYNASEMTCGSMYNNRFILGRTSPPSTHVLTLVNDVITSIGAVTYTLKSRRRSFDPVVDTLVLGTEKSRLMKVVLKNNEFKSLKFFSQSDASLGPFMANPAYDYNSGSFYFLTNRSVTEVPVVRCSVYTTCSACFRSKEECIWSDDQCQFRDNVKLSDRLIQCPPVVFNFEPKDGPKQGGTIVSFHGNNFGSESLPNNKDFYLKVSIGSKVCSLLERTNTFFTCRIEGKENDNLDVSQGIITIEASDTSASNYHSLGYNVNGKITLEDKFTFKSASLTGVHPTYGPFAGGTRLTIAGSDLNIGSNATVLIGKKFCTVVVRSPQYVICETPSLDKGEMNVTQSKQIEVSIDNSNMIINGDQVIPLNSSTLFANDNESEGPQITRPKRKRQSYRDLEHPFSNISTFISMQLAQNAMLTFGESFQYRLNPIVTAIYDRTEDERHTKTFDNFYTVASGQTMLTFEGEYLNSVFYPMLSLYFEKPSSTSGSKPKKNVSSVLCSVVSAKIITCLLPALPREMHPIEVDRPVRARYVLHLDGKQIDSDNLPLISNANGRAQLKGTRILYYPDPELTPLSEPLLVSTDSLQVELQGHYLMHDLPFKIFLNNSIKCIVTAEAPSSNLLRCKLNPEEEMIDFIYGEELDLFVTIGNRTENIGIVKLQNNASLSTVGIVFIVLAIFMLVVFICAFVYYKTQKMKATNSKDAYGWTELVPKFKPKTLKEFFNEAYTNLDLYNQLESNAKIIDPKEVQKLNAKLGDGHFGIVTQGRFKNELVAIKTLKQKINLMTPVEPVSENSESESTISQDKILEGFFDEAITMKDFNHINVLSLIGVTLVDDYPSILLPYMNFGDLATYVRNDANNPSVRDLLDYSIQVARGMTYLAERNFVHRDLAARNCLIGLFNGEAIVKVADFGLSRQFENKNYYRMNTNKELPFRWMPPELLNGENIVTSKSDVWSYGVLVWELTTRGQTPYGQLDSPGVLQLLQCGRRLTKPQFCPDIIHSIMSLCWLDNVNERPEFKDILACMEEAFRMLHLQESNTYVNLAEQVPNCAVQTTSNSCQFDYRRPDTHQQVQEYFEKSHSILRYFTNQHPELYDDMEADGVSQYPAYAPPSYSEANAMPSSNSVVMSSPPTTSNGYGHETHFPPTITTPSSSGSKAPPPSTAQPPMLNCDYSKYSDSSTLPR